MSTLLFSQRPSGKRSLQGGANQAPPPSKEKPLQLIMIREELITLTGDPYPAALLGQFIYWCHQVPNFALYMEEEKNATSTSKDQSFQHGWFNKSIHELIEETFLNISVMALHRYLRFLIERKWIQTRTNPECKWDGRIQYRVNLRKLCREFHKHGYDIPRFAKAHFLGENESDVLEERPL